MKPNGRPWPLQVMDNIDIAPEYECPAIKRCCQAWYTAFKKAEAAGTNPVSVRLRANEAYRFAMPPLNSSENISGFIACVVHGMAVGAIIDDLGTRWLYAAQVVSAYFKGASKESKSQKKKGLNGSQRKTGTPTPSCVAVQADLTSSSPDTCEQPVSTIKTNN